MVWEGFPNNSQHRWGTCDLCWTLWMDGWLTLSQAGGIFDYWFTLISFIHYFIASPIIEKHFYAWCQNCILSLIQWIFLYSNRQNLFCILMHPNKKKLQFIVRLVPGTHTLYVSLRNYALISKNQNLIRVIKFWHSTWILDKYHPQNQYWIFVITPWTLFHSMYLILGLIIETNIGQQRHPGTLVCSYMCDTNCISCVALL